MAPNSFLFFLSVFPPRTAVVATGGLGVEVQSLRARVRRRSLAAPAQRAPLCSSGSSELFLFYLLPHVRRVSLIPAFRWESWGVRSVHVLPKVTQLGSHSGSVGPSLPLKPVPLRWQHDGEAQRAFLTHGALGPPRNLSRWSGPGPKTPQVLISSREAMLLVPQPEVERCQPALLPR